MAKRPPKFAAPAPEPAPQSADIIADPQPIDPAFSAPELCLNPNGPPPDRPCVLPETSPYRGEQLVTIEAPLAIATNAYSPRRLRRDLSLDRAATLKRLMDGLHANGVVVDGRRVENPDQAIGWILDQLGR